MQHVEATTLAALIVTALTLGSVHTFLGPDHYVPFIALARSGRWTLHRTLAVTLLCGFGHVLSSVAIGLIGVAAGIAVSSLEWLEGTRGDIAIWSLIAFGLVYGSWGVWRALRSRAHTHEHGHRNGSSHEHEHDHHSEHLHPHESGSRLVWAMFIVFILGPCEPLIPVLMYPAAAHDWMALAVVTGVFCLTTLASMSVAVTAGWMGSRLVRLGTLERWTHAISGGVLAATGAAVLAFGL